MVIYLKVKANQTEVDIHVIVRPEAQRFLYEMNNYFEIVIFTASLSEVNNIFYDWY